MKSRLCLLILLGIATISLTNCDDKTDSLCGIRKIWSNNVSNYYNFEELNGSKRTLIYEDVAGPPQNICTTELSEATFRVTTKVQIVDSDSIFIYGKVYWGLGREERILTNSLSEFYGTISDINLKDFGNKKGFINLQIKFIFPTHGSLTNDTIYIKSLIDKMNITYDYNEYL